MLHIYRTDNQKIQEIQEFTEGCWVKLTDPDMEEIKKISDQFALDMDDVKAALDEEERSRVSLEDAYTLTLIDIPASEMRHKKLMYTTVPLGIILKEEVIITICRENTAILNHFVETKVREFSTKKKMRFLYQILLYTANMYQMELRIMDNKRIAIENRIGEKKEKDSDLLDLHDLKSTLVYFETSLRANGMVIERLQRFKRFPQYPDDEDLMEDIIIENKQAIEMATIYRDIIDGTRELMSDVINNRMNNVMKYLTSITIVMAIPTIISGLYGMNVNGAGMPFANMEEGFLIVCLITIVFSILILVILHKKKML